MNKRTIKKKAMRIVRDMSDYTDVPLETIKSECFEDLYKAIKRKDKFYLELHWDCVTIDLMIKYQCGWWFDK